MAVDTALSVCRYRFVWPNGDESGLGMAHLVWSSIDPDAGHRCCQAERQVVKIALVAHFFSIDMETGTRKAEYQKFIRRQVL